MPNIKKKPGQRRDSVAKATKKKWLAKLLADKHAVGLLLEFLKNTEVGSREGTAERMAEWGQRRDQDGKDWLGGW